VPKRVPVYRPQLYLGGKRDRAPAQQRYDRLKRDPELATFYRSTRWRKLSELKRAEQPLCEMCLVDGLVTKADLVHHLRPVREAMDDALILENLQSVCRPCHARAHTAQD
jgi:5-methylcytosine-specific restriction enzyme A